MCHYHISRLQGVPNPSLGGEDVFRNLGLKSGSLLGK